MQFLAPDIVTMGILFAAVFSGIEIIWDRQFGFLKETLVAPVSRFEIVLGRTLGSATVALIHGSIVFLVCLAAGFRPVHPLLLPLAFSFMVLIAIMCTAIGTAVGSVLQDMQGFQLIINFIVLPLFFFSSALFPVPDLPGAMRVVVRLNPLSVISGLQGNNVRYLEAGNWDRVERSAAELDGMSRGFERTIGRRIRIRQSDDAGASCSGSSRLDPPSAFSACTVRFTTPSTSNATSSPDPHCGSSGPKRPHSGEMPSQRHDAW